MPTTLYEFHCWLSEQIDALPRSNFTLSDFRQAAETVSKAGEIAVALGLPDLTRQLPVHYGYLGIGAARVLLREYLKASLPCCYCITEQHGATLEL